MIQNLRVTYMLHHKIPLANKTAAAQHSSWYPSHTHTLEATSYQNNYALKAVIPIT